MARRRSANQPRTNVGNQSPANNGNQAATGNQENAGNAANQGNQANAAQMLTDLLNAMQNNNNNNAYGGNLRIVEQFRQSRLPTFNGRDGPAAVEEWLRALERIFRLVGGNDVQNITCATFQLVEDAGHWWEGYWRTRTDDERNNLTWDGFKETVMEKFFPRSYKDQKETEFLNFRQRSMSITEYERKFNQLSRFAPHLVDTDLKKALRFGKGLRAHIGAILCTQGDLEYSVMVTRAQDIEATLAADEWEKKLTYAPEKRKWDGEKHNNNEKRSWNGDSQRDEELNKQVRAEEKFGPSTQADKPSCTNCYKKHNGECLFSKDNCYYCKEPGHSSNECPKKRNGSKRRDEQSGGRARIYGMAQDSGNKN